MKKNIIGSSNWKWYRDVLRVLVKKELLVRYKGSFLGFFWSILNPLANAYTFYLLFGILMRMNVPHFIVVLLSALFPWQAFSNSVLESANTFIGNITLVKKVAFPRQAIPLVMNLQNYVHFLMALPIYLVFMFFEGVYPAWNWLWGIPLLLFLTIVSSYGLSLFFGSLNVFFRDLSYIVAIFLQIGFFATPIMYAMEMIPEELHWVFQYNPIAPIFICWRNLLAYNIIDLRWLWPTLFYSSAFIALGVFAFRKLQFKFAEAI